MFIKRRSRLILLMACDSRSTIVDSEDQSLASLRHYIRHHTYIDYCNDNKWLDKLVYALPITGMLPVDEEIDEV